MRDVEEKIGADYIHKDKIVLTDMTWSPTRPEKARIAFEKPERASPKPEACPKSGNFR